MWVFHAGIIFQEELNLKKLPNKFVVDLLYGYELYDNCILYFLETN